MTFSTFKQLARPILVLALPLMLQGLLINLMGFVDALMIGQLGEQVISALGNSQQLLSFVFLLTAALSIGGSVMIAQYQGAGDEHNIQRSSQALILAGIVVGCLLAFIVFHYSHWFISLLTTDLFRASDEQSDVPEQALIYLQVVAWAMPAMLLSQMLTACLNAVGNTKTPVKIAVAFNVINFILNYLLIFGLEMPGLWPPVFTPLGFQGAAIATLIAANGQAITLCYWSAKNTTLLRRSSQGLSIELLKPLLSILKLGYPSSVDGFYWQGARVFYTVLMNAIGTLAYAAYAIVRTLKSLFMLPIGGLQTATAIRIGHLLGAGHFNRAKATAAVAVITGMLIMLVPAGLLVFFAHPLLSLYAITEQTYDLAIFCTWVLAGSLFFTAINAVIPGLLRAGGDAAAVMNITLISFAFCGAPLSWLFGVYLSLGLKGAFVAIALEEVFKAGLFIFRMRQWRWLNALNKGS